MSNNYYSECIEVLSDLDVIKTKRLLTEIGKKHPSIIVKTAKSLGFIEEELSLEEKLRELLSNGKKMSAVKLYKAKTKTSLRDAKKFVDSLATTPPSVG